MFHYLNFLSLQVWQCLTLVLAMTAAATSWSYTEGPIDLAEIKAADHFPQSDAEVIRKSVRIELTEEYLGTTRNYTAIKIKSVDAINDYSQIIVQYDAYYEEVDLIFANTIDKDGSRQPLDIGATQVQTPPSPYFYQDRRNLVFSLPSLKPGSIIEFEYVRREIKPRIDNFWSTNLFFSYWHVLQDARRFRSDPVRLAEYQVISPKFMKLRHLGFSGGKEFMRDKRRSGDQVSFFLSAKNIPRLPNEPLAPSIEMFLPYVSFSTLGSWDEVQDWASKLFEGQVKPSVKIDELARQIEQSSSSDIEKLRAVYQYVNQKVRYIYSHVGRGGYTPHPVDEVLAKGYGDCKDQTIVVVSLLRAMGIRAYPALVNTSGIDPNFEERRQPHFDHMVTYIPSMEESLRYLDTTGASAMFPGPTSYLSNNSTLILTSRKYQFVEGYQPGTSRDGIDITTTLRTEDDSIAGDILFEFRGVFEESYRSAWNQSSTENKRLIADSLRRAVFANSDMEDFDVANSHDLFAPFSLTLDISFGDAWDGDPNPIMFSAPLQVAWRELVMRTGLTPPADRISPVYLRNGYSMSMTLKARQPNEDYYPAVQMNGIDFQNEHLNLAQIYSPSDNSVSLSSKVDFMQGFVSLDDYAEWVSMIDRFIQTPNWKIEYKKDVEKSARLMLEQQESSVENTNALIEHMLSTGEFEEAHELALETTKKENANGKSFYLLGLSQAYMGEPDEAELSLEIAEDMGYEQ